MFVGFMIDVATFDLLPGDLIDWLFDFPVKDSYNLAFQSTHYDSMYSM